MSHVLALDQGTTSSRAVLFDADGAIRGLAQREFPQIFPRPGWVEHDPEAIWVSQLGVARAVLAQAGVAATELAAIGIANQRETVIVWDRRSGVPVGNAIVWQDRRTADLCERLRAEGLDALFARRTGLVIDPYFSGTKLHWILEHVPDARARAQAGELAFGTVDSWLIWKLSGGRIHATDATNASRTLLYDIHTGDWDDELLQVLGVPRAMLPGIVGSSGVIGEALPSVLGAAVPIAGVAGDQQAALFGQRCVRPGMVKNTYGTGCFALMNTGERPCASDGRLLASPAWRIGGREAFALEGSVFVAGAIVQWLRDGLGIIARSGEIEALARTVSDNGGVYLVPALTGLGAPHWDPHARGAILGLTRGASRGHIARAALESIAFQSADLVDAMQRDAGMAVSELRVDGGAAVNDMLMQFQADVLGVPVVRPTVTETTALGAAYLAGLGVGYWPDDAVLDAHWQVDRVFEPAMPRARVAALRADWLRAVERAKGWSRP